MQLRVSWWLGAPRREPARHSREGAKRRRPVAAEIQASSVQGIQTSSMLLLLSMHFAERVESCQEHGLIRDAHMGVMLPSVFSLRRRSSQNCPSSFGFREGFRMCPAMASFILRVFTRTSRSNVLATEKLGRLLGFCLQSHGPLVA